MLTPADLARRHGAGLVLDGDPDERGVPRSPLTWVDLDAPVVPGAVEAILASVVPTIGVASALRPELDALLEALDLSVAPGGDRRTVADLDHDLVRRRAAAAPLATVSLGRLLRQTAVLPVREGLAAESATYSTLLAGPERASLLADRQREPDDGPRLRLERDGDVLRIALCRPDRRNRVDARLRDDLWSALGIAHADPQLTVVLTADGGDWSTGGDLDEFGSLPDVATAHVVRQARSVGWALHSLGDRARAELHGRCMGSGIEMPAFAAHVSARGDLSASLPELGLGLVPGAGGTVSITRRIGRWRTCWMVLTGTAIDAQTALSWGLVDEVLR